MRRLAIDPGDKHVGWAREFSNGSVEAGEWTAEETYDKVGRIFTSITSCPDELIIEEFVLYAHKSGSQAWSPMLTSEMIGGLKLLARQHGVPVFEQGASIKKPTRSQLPARGITQVGPGVHARDAELHLYYRILTQRGDPACS